MAACGVRRILAHQEQGFRGLRIGGLRIGVRRFALSRPRTPSKPPFVGRFGICARNGAERTPRELRRP
eukprot:11545027-Alexandrium_andersonii.AAC.1